MRMTLAPQRAISSNSRRSKWPLLSSLSGSEILTPWNTTVACEGSTKWLPSTRMAGKRLGSFVASKGLGYGASQGPSTLLAGAVAAAAGAGFGLGLGLAAAGASALATTAGAGLTADGPACEGLAQATSRSEMDRALVRVGRGFTRNALLETPAADHPCALRQSPCRSGHGRDRTAARGEPHFWITGPVSRPSSSSNSAVSSSTFTGLVR